MDLNQVIQAYLKLASDYLSAEGASQEEAALYMERLQTCYKEGCNRRMFCGECGCPLLAKVRTKGVSCPLKRWKR